MTGRSAAALVAGLLCTLAACGEERSPASGTAQMSGAPAVREYRVRGVLEQLPAVPGGQLRVHHEAVPDLVGASGEVEAMPAMSMPFPTAEELDLAGLAAGDAVAFTLRVDWDATPPATVTAVERLAAGSELELD